MARKYDIDPKANGGYTLTKRPGWIWWTIYALFVLGAIIQPNWGVRIAGITFAVLTAVVLIARKTGRTS